MKRFVSKASMPRLNPPLRSELDRAALLKGLADGTIDAIATDHAPHAEYEKQWGMDRAPFGIVGLETALALTLRLVEKGRLVSGASRAVLDQQAGWVVGTAGWHIDAWCVGRHRRGGSCL